MTRLIPLFLLAIGACSSSKPPSDEPLLPPEQKQELLKFVEDQMAKLPGQAQLSDTQREDARPFVRDAARKVFEAAQRYHANPTGKNLKRFQDRALAIRKELRRNIQPLMTSGQLNNFLTVYDQTMQEIRVRRLARQ